MNPDINPDNMTEKSESGSESLGFPTQSSTHRFNETLQPIVEKVSVFLSSFPDYLTDFFIEYKQPLLTLALIVGAIITVKLLLAILDAASEIPLLLPLLELIGLGYSIWFLYRYILQASNRQELVDVFNTFKAKILG
jgi:hypothetical protein